MGLCVTVDDPEGLNSASVRCGLVRDSNSAQHTVNPPLLLEVGVAPLLLRILPLPRSQVRDSGERALGGVTNRLEQLAGILTCGVESIVKFLASAFVLLPDVGIGRRVWDQADGIGS